MTIIIPADPIPIRVRLTAVTASAIIESPFSFAQDSEQHPGERWLLEAEWPMMQQEFGGPIARAFAQAGRHDTFTFAIGIPARGTAITFAPSGGGGGTKTLPLSSGISGTLKDGDYIEVNDGSDKRLHIVTADVANSANSIPVWPTLRGTPAAAVAVGASARGTFRLSEVGLPVDVVSPILYDIIIQATEAL